MTAKSLIKFLVNFAKCWKIYQTGNMADEPNYPYEPSQYHTFLDFVKHMYITCINYIPNTFRHDSKIRRLEFGDRFFQKTSKLSHMISKLI